MSSSENQENMASMEMKQNKSGAPDNKLLDQAKPTNTEQLVTSTNMAAAAAPNRSYLVPDIVEEILDLLPIKSIVRFRSVSSLFAIKFIVPKLLHDPCLPNFSKFGMKPSDDTGLFTGVVLSDYGVGDAKNQGYMALELLSAAKGNNEARVWVQAVLGCLKVVSSGFDFQARCRGCLDRDPGVIDGGNETRIWKAWWGMHWPETEFLESELRSRRGSELLVIGVCGYSE
ncbi:hypothetical protein Tsubulata_037111 [Turnera subulata]|uniref:F-box domain-containing protein n=1 Tax=Turnera subulata TaxID=218843 RepID=A0A9Q0JKZ9_9ROSI|nr:hypothetical protein Tsubulata_037111 [Turnera subulata]